MRRNLDKTGLIVSSIAAGYWRFKRHVHEKRNIGFLQDWIIIGLLLMARYFSIKADPYIAFRAHAVPLPCRSAKGLECVFPIWFTQCDRIWFTLAMPCPCHAPTMPFFSRPQHSMTVSWRPCYAVALRRTAWPEHGMASVNQTRPHCVNQIRKTHSEPLAAWHGNGMLCVNRP